MEEGVERARGASAAEGGNAVVRTKGGCGHACAAVEGDDGAEEGLSGGEAGLALHLVEDHFHLREHARAAELADDEVVGAGAVAKGPSIGSGTRVRVLEEMEGTVGILLETEA